MPASMQPLGLRVGCDALLIEIKRIPAKVAEGLRMLGD